MKTIRSLMLFSSISLAVLILSCKDGSTGASQEALTSSKGTMTIKARTSPLYKSLPPWPITVTLLRAKAIGFDTVTSAITNKEGECTFSDLPHGTYVGLGLADDHYPDSTFSNYVYIQSDVTAGTAMMYHQPRYHLAPDTIIISVDTTINVDRVFSTFIMNDGAQDTLHCSFSTAYVPEWCALTISTTIFRPLYFGTSENNFTIMTKATTFPRHSLPITIPIPFSHQFEQDTMLVRFIHQKI